MCSGRSPLSLGTLAPATKTCGEVVRVGGRSASEPGVARKVAGGQVGHVTIDAEQNLISVDVSDAEMQARRAAWTQPPFKAERGTLAKYIRLVKSASEGCVTDE